MKLRQIPQVILTTPSNRSSSPSTSSAIKKTINLLDPSLPPKSIPGRENEYSEIKEILTDSILSGGGHCLYISG